MSQNVKFIGEWVETRRATSRKAGSVLISFFSDFVVAHGGAITLGSLVEAGALVGISEQAMRSSVNRHVADGWLCTVAQGRRSICRFSERGQKRHDVISRRIFLNDHRDWSGEWDMIATNIVANDPLRHADLVRDIQWAGFGKLSENVFVRPKLDGKKPCCSVELKDMLDASMVCFTGVNKKCTPDSALRLMLKTVWDLELVQARYERFINIYQPLLKWVLKARELAGETSFTIRSMLIHDYRRVRLLDPLLPKELVPANWNGEKAFSIARELYERLASPSEHYITANLRGVDGPLPKVETWFYDRFGGIELA
jgi:phenylacetic acid degradation operon negative regulatory protein